jgi:hypothetical protein
MDNLNTQPMDNGQTQQEPQDVGQEQQLPQAPSFSWKSQLNADLQKSPTLQKFDDSPDGLQKSVESYLQLEKLLGHNKVPVPKDANDKEAWAQYSKAFGIPDNPDGYGLPDVQTPDELKGLTFDKREFSAMAHAQKLTPSQAKGLWEVYTKDQMSAVIRAKEQYKETITQNINALRSEWGDAYDANIDLGQTVINKFSSDQETNDFITSTLAEHPNGIKFLASIGKQFAENKVGEFAVKRYAMSPEEAQAEIDKVRADSNHPYMNDKAPVAEHEKAVQYIDGLYRIAMRGK